MTNTEILCICYLDNPYTLRQTTESEYQGHIATHPYALGRHPLFVDVEELLPSQTSVQARRVNPAS